MASQASPASSNDSMGKEVFLRRPPLPFDWDCERDERSRNYDVDEDWLPEVKDIITGNFHLMIDMTGDSDGEDDTESSSRYPRSDTVTQLTSATPTRLQSSRYGTKPPWACQRPKAANSIDSEQAEIPVSLDAVQVCPVASGSSHHPNDRDGGGESAPITAVTEAVTAHIAEDSSVEEQQDQEKKEQELEGTNNDGGIITPSRQPTAPIPASTVRVPESSFISTCRSSEAVQGCCTHTQTMRPIVSQAREVACTESCISIQGITFLRVEGQREAADGLEYQFVAKMWLRPGERIPSNLVHVYKRDVARQARLLTLRTRRRINEDAGVVKVKRCAARRKI